MIRSRRMINHFFYILISCFFLSSCSFFTKEIELLVNDKEETSENSSQQDTAHKTNKKSLYCFENNKAHLLLEDESTMTYYRPLESLIFDSTSFSFIQKAAMLSLIEMSRRPDEASPGARLQYFLHYKNSDYYFDFKPVNLNDDTKMSYIKGVEMLIKNFDKSKSLESLADYLDKTIPQNINVSSNFETFLHENKIDLLKNNDLVGFFFKGDEVLTKYESFKKISIKKIINYFYKDKIADDSFYDSSSNSLFNPDSQNIQPGLTCNVDINKESILKDEIFFSEHKRSHTFALKEGDNVFVALSSAVIKKPIENIHSTYFLKSLPGLIPFPVCHIKNNLQDITLFSTTGRNPVQHLKHLISYDLNQVDSYQSLEDLLSFSRHLYLNDPDRILYESKKGRKSQLDLFLTMNFPIYHVESLGEIIGTARFKNGPREERSLIIDDRGQSRLWCSP